MHSTIAGTPRDALFHLLPHVLRLWKKLKNKVAYVYAVFMTDAELNAGVMFYALTLNDIQVAQTC